MMIFLHFYPMFEFYLAGTPRRINSPRVTSMECKLQAPLRSDASVTEEAMWWLQVEQTLNKARDVLAFAE